MNSNYISYFDILGFKDAVLNTNPDDFVYRIGHILRDIEHARALDKSVQDHRKVIIGDEKQWRTNVHYISDTILFWPKSSTSEDIENWIRVSSLFNTKMNQINMPTRGCLFFGEFHPFNWDTVSSAGGRYTVASMYGKALVQAHIKAENQSWASTVVDETVVNELNKNPHLLEVLRSLCSEETVPYKKIPENQQQELVLKLFPNNQCNEEGFAWYAQWIMDRFNDDNRSTDNQRVQEILRNTIELLHRQVVKKEPV